MITGKVHINEMIGGRYDNSFVLFHHNLSAYKYPTTPLYKLIIDKPQYGSGEAGIPRYGSEYPRYIRITDIDENGLLIDDIGVTARNVEEKYILNNNDILIARSGNTVGKSYIHKSDKIKGKNIFAGYLIRFVVDCGKILPDYFFIFTKLSVFSEWVKVTQRVTGQPNINAEEYGNLPIPVPPIELQLKIVDIYNNAQKERIKKIREAERLLDSIDDYLFSSLKIEKPQSNTTNILSQKQNVSSVIGGRLDPLQFHIERTDMIDRIKQVRFCRLKDVVNNTKSIVKELTNNDTYIGLENIDGKTGEYKPLTEKESVSSAAVFCKGNILFPKLRPYLNKVHRAQFDGCCSTEFHVFDARNIHPEFLSIVLRSKMILAQTKYLMTGNTLPRLQTTDIENLIIPYPDIETQEKIVAFVTKIKCEANKLREDGCQRMSAVKKEIEHIIIG